MAVTAEFTQYVLDQLEGLGGVTARRMFGGVGLYGGSPRGGALFFALIAGDVLYFKVDDSNRAPFIDCGARPFRPFKDKPRLSMSYYEVPAQVLEDAEQCTAWARRSLAVALASTSRGTARRPRTPRSARGAAPRR
jgi:DNA transformation protein